MGRIVYATAMSHVLYPDYYGKNVGPPGRRMVEELIAEVREMGRAMLAARPVAQSPFVSHPGRRQSVSP